MGPLFQASEVQERLVRLLYIYAIRHPASGYVQGMNDLVTPFFLVFLAEHVEDPERCDVARLPVETLDAVEADSYWCLCKLLQQIQDNYTFSQPGIQRMVQKLKELVQRVDAPLAAHIEEQG